MNTSTQPQIFSVSELTSQIKEVLEPRFLKIQIRGEMSNLKVQSSGHCYFTLKDEGSQIASVIFQGYLRALPRPPKEGDRVVVTADLSIYAPRGSYQLIVKSLMYEGVGDLLLRLHALKNELAAKGFFDPSRKRPIPHFPKVIGVVTSPTGAVIQDILNILKRRSPSFHLRLIPVRVQGETAHLEIALAIDEFNKHNLADVLIVGRGGGSLEDLWPFNERLVAEAIYRSKIPVISAVGHETDFSIADFVADLRAPTPSAAAEIVSKEAHHLLQTLERSGKHLVALMQSKVQSYQRRFERLLHHPSLTGERLFFTQRQRIDEAIEKSALILQNKIAKTRNLLENRALTLSFHSPMLKIAKLKDRIGYIKNNLHALNPKMVLQRGYAIVYNEEGTLIRSALQANNESSFSLEFADGTLNVRKDHERK